MSVASSLDLGGRLRTALQQARQPASAPNEEAQPRPSADQLKRILDAQNALMNPPPEAAYPFGVGFRPGQMAPLPAEPTEPIRSQASPAEMALLPRNALTVVQGTQDPLVYQRGQTAATPGGATPGGVDYQAIQRQMQQDGIAPDVAAQKAEQLKRADAVLGFRGGRFMGALAQPDAGTAERPLSPLDFVPNAPAQGNIGIAQPMARPGLNIAPGASAAALAANGELPPGGRAGAAAFAAPSFEQFSKQMFQGRNPVGPEETMAAWSAYAPLANLEQSAQLEREKMASQERIARIAHDQQLSNQEQVLGYQAYQASKAKGGTDAEAKLAQDNAVNQFRAMRAPNVPSAGAGSPNATPGAGGQKQQPSVGVGGSQLPISLPTSALAQQLTQDITDPSGKLLLDKFLTGWQGVGPKASPGEQLGAIEAAAGKVGGTGNLMNALSGRLADNLLKTGATQAGNFQLSKLPTNDYWRLGDHPHFYQLYSPETGMATRHNYLTGLTLPRGSATRNALDQEIQSLVPLLEMTQKLHLQQNPPR